MDFKRRYRIVIMKKLITILFLISSFCANCQLVKGVSKVRRGVDVYAYSFDGIDASITFPHSSALNFTNTDKWTFETWVNFPDTNGAVKYLYSKFDDATSRGIQICGNVSRLNIKIQNGASNKIDIATAPFILNDIYALAQDCHFPVNKWLHIIISYSGNSLASGVKIYFDGKEYVTRTINSNTLSATTQNTSSLLIGSNATVFSDHKQALTRVFNDTLTSVQIVALYNSGKPKYTHGLTGCIFEMKVNDDAFASNFIVLETAGSNNGISAGMLSTQKARSTTIDGLLDMGVQTYTGNNIYYETFAKAGMEPTSAVMHSPFSDKLRTPIIYDASTGNTFIGWQQSPNLGYNRNSRLLCVMHNSKTVTPSGRGHFLTPGANDTHSAPGVCITPSGEVLLAHEENHNSPIYIERTTNKSVGSLASIYTIPKYHSYPNFAVIGSTIFLELRGSLTNGNGPLEDARLYKSTDNGTTWDAGIKFISTDSTVLVERPYVMSVHDPAKICYVITMRNDGAGKFTHMFYIESSDGITFTNRSGSFSKNVVADGFITRADLVNCRADFDPANGDILCKAAVKTATGNIVSINNHSTTGYRITYYTGGVWATKTLSIPTYVAAGHAPSYRADFFGLYSYSDTHFVFWRIEIRGGFNVVVQYETTDFFDTIDAGTIVSASNKNHEQLQCTFNVTGAGKIVIAANVLGEYNNLFIYEYTP